MTGTPHGRLERLGWLLAALALIGLRLPHLAGPLDDPHSWRQCDTVSYTLDFFRHGIDLMHPAVSWLGAHRTLIFEFPITEAMGAVLYSAFGPSPLWDRLVSLVFCALATVYLFAFVRHVASERVAWLAALAYLAFPLGQFFSRAPQMDFAAVAFTHGTLYHLTMAIERRSFRHGGLAAGWGSLAALVKAPYLLPVLGPLALAALAAPTVSTLAVGALGLGIPAVLFVLWRRHVDAVNAAVPDWTFLPGFYKEVNPLWWYMGSFAQRLDPASWATLAHRLVFHIATPIGSVLALLGLGWRPTAHGERRFGALALALAWWVAAAGYVLLFFPLNVIHHYYQVPLLGPAAMMVALGTDAVARRVAAIPRLRAPWPGAATALLFALFIATCVVSVHRLGYYRVDWLRVEAGRLIAQAVPAGDLIVASDHGTTHSDPRLLVRADRDGWPLAIDHLDADRIERLAALGARWLAVVTDPDAPDAKPPASLEPGLVERVPVVHAGRMLGTLHLYDLGRMIQRNDVTAHQEGDTRSAR